MADVKEVELVLATVNVFEDFAAELASPLCCVEKEDNVDVTVIEEPSLPFCCCVFRAR